MTKYKDIRGTHITTVANDPPAPVNGQMWYNSTTQVMKGFTESPVGSWATGGNLNTARYVPGGGGSQTAGIMFGGQPGSGTSADQTELYNGTNWTESGDLNTARERCSPAANTNTAALCIDGVVYPGATNKNLTESWNGSSWTEVGDTSISHNGRFGFGTPAAAVVAGGGTSSMNETETWNGSAWSSPGATLNQGRKDNEAGGAGTSTNGIVTGGNNGSIYDNTEYWNGSAWSEQADLNTARSGASLSGGQPAAIFSGGTPPIKANVELWNGSCWSETTDMPTGKRNHAGSKVTGSTSALVFGGIGPSPGALTQTLEWTSPTTSTVTFTAS
jgi:hypothetical protein|tara:strand:+ start:1722 stop:2714 length:993 start_codon:yes stop_codon:yes gene_type:complete